MLPILILLTVGLAAAEKYSIPEPKFQLLKPRGFRASIPDVEGIRLFAFHGNLNKELEDMGIGQFSEDVMKKKNGRWVFENRKIKLRQGDVINYWVFVMKNGEGYKFSNGSYKCKLDNGVRTKRHSPWSFHHESWRPSRRFHPFSSEETIYLKPDHYFNHHFHHHPHHNHHPGCNHENENEFQYPDTHSKFGSDEDDDDDVSTSTEQISNEITKVFETTREVSTEAVAVTTNVVTNEFTSRPVTSNVETDPPLTMGRIEVMSSTDAPTTTTGFPKIDIRFGK